MTVFFRVISWIATFGCFIAGIFTGSNYGDFISSYKNNVRSVEFIENDFDTALPQTDIYNIISNHFNSANADGKEKKVIVIGYDGCRADNLTLCSSPETSAILTVLGEGGEVELSYCGGVNYPRINTQDTSTAPGWCSMLTGKWADEHGITGNSIVKSNDNLTLLTTLVESKTIDSSAFYVSWGGHFTSDDSTYKLERQYCEEKGLNVNMLKADDDAGTEKNVIADLQKDDCSDFIFSILEYNDHIGHDKSFCPNYDKQAQAFADAEAAGMRIINAIKSRPTYENEDWLIIITSDHGGYNSWHGGPTMQERYTFIAANKEFSSKLAK